MRRLFQAGDADVAWCAVPAGRWPGTIGAGCALPVSVVTGDSAIKRRRRPRIPQLENDVVSLL